MGLQDTINWQGNGPATSHAGQAKYETLWNAARQALHQAAQQRAYAHAYSRGNFEGGTSFIGNTNFHLAQMRQTGAGTSEPGKHGTIRATAFDVETNPGTAL